MTNTDLPQVNPPSLNDLMVGFVNRPVDADSIEAEAGALGEVEPHEVSVGFRADPRMAWQEGFGALGAIGLTPSTTPTAPADWAAVVIRHDSTAAQPFALANYPQRVRDLTVLLQSKNLSQLRPKCESRPAATALVKWAEKQFANNDVAAGLHAAAVLRAANDLDAASELLDRVQAKATSTSTTALQNERAALLWQRGEWEKAAAIWEQLPDSVAIWFNRGMSALFLQQSTKARECLKKAVAQLPETSGWHHLGSLYLALAEMR